MKIQTLKYGYLLIGIFSLAGCASPEIKESYDEFKGTKVCRLEPYRFKSEIGFSKGRVTNISLESISHDSIKAILTATVSRGLGSYDSFKSGSKLKFTTKTSDDDKIEEFTFTGQELSSTHHTTSQSTVISGRYVTMDVQMSDDFITFIMKPEQLRKIIEAPVTEFYFESGKHPITGEFSNSDKQAFKQFMHKCLPSSGEKNDKL